MLVIKRVQQPGQLLEVIRHPVRLIGHRTALEDRGIGGELANQPQFIRVRQHRQIRLAREGTIDASRGRDAPEAGDPGMGILHIVHGIIG